MATLLDCNEDQIAILEAVSEGFCAANVRWEITYVNQAAEAFLGVGREFLLGQDAWAMFPALATTPLGDSFHRVMAARESEQFEIVSPIVAGRWVSIVVFPLPTGGVGCAFRDITDHKAREASLEDALSYQDSLFKELTHRVTNSLHAVAAMLTLKAKGSPDLGVRTALRRAAEHVHAMGLVHRRLYRSGTGIAYQDAGEYLRALAGELAEALSGEPGRPAIVADADAGCMVSTDDAITIGLLVSELVMNAVKYAFPDRGDGTIAVNLHRGHGECMVVTVMDDGVGLPDGFDMVSSTGGMGMRIIHAQVRQLGGDLFCKSHPTIGTEFTFTIPAERVMQPIDATMQMQASA